MYASPFGEGLSIKGTYVLRMDQTRKNDLSLSPWPWEVVTPSVREGLAVYISI